MTSRKIPRYKLSSGHGDLPKGKVMFLSLHHQPTLDGHRMLTPNHCGKGAAYSVPEGLLVEFPYDEMDED
jgi:hypothetical protein